MIYAINYEIGFTAAFRDRHLQTQNRCVQVLGYSMTMLPTGIGGGTVDLGMRRGNSDYWKGRTHR
jgi:hypothetical protein